MTLATERRVASGEAPDKTELLRQLLEREQQRGVDYREALEVSKDLIEFFEVLAGVA